MKFSLEYFDNTLQKQITQPITADSTAAARNACFRILQDKDYDNPGLYGPETDYCEE